jgi:hypothetical protein
MLPRELTDIIIDFLHDDKLALAACSLACRAFRPASQVHLLESIWLCQETHIRQFPFFLDSSPSIAPLIQNIVLVAAEDFENWPTASVRCIDTLPNFRSLSFARLYFDDDVLPFVERWGTRITSLSMEDCHFPHWDSFLEFLLMFPSLEQLILEEVYCTGPCDASQSPTASDLRTLIIRGGFLAEALQWLLSLEHLPPLHTLSLCSIVASELPDVGSLLVKLGPSLRHLELKFYTSPDNILYECMFSHIFALPS